MSFCRKIIYSGQKSRRDMDMKKPDIVKDGTLIVAVDVGMETNRDIARP
jgi:hypothetical protein